MNIEPPTPPLYGETSSDLDDALIADGQKGIDKEALPKRIIRVVGADDDLCRPASQWYVPGVEPGDLYRGRALPIIHTPEKLLFLTILLRTYFKGLKPDAKGNNKVIAHWGKEPNDTQFVPKMGRRRNDGTLVLKFVELYGLVEGAAWMLQLVGMDGKLAVALNEKIDASHWRDAQGKSHPCAIYTTRAALWTDVVSDGDNTRINIKLELAGVYRGEGGPTRDEVACARDLHNELLATLPKYPDPDVVALDTRRVVNGPKLVEQPPVNDAPPVNSIDDYDSIPF